MNFSEWLIINESVFYDYPQWPFNARQLSTQSPEKKNIMWQQILKVLQDERWNGKDIRHVITALRHKFTNYDKQMDLIRQQPIGCNKLRNRIMRTKECYDLIQGIAQHLVPPQMRQTLSQENYQFLSDKINEYQGESYKLRLSCGDMFKVPPAAAVA